MRARVADEVDKMVSELGIDLPDSINPNSTSDMAIDMGMDVDIDPDTILTPLNNHQTRSNTLTSRIDVKPKPKPKSKFQAKGKITAKSKTRTYTDTKFQVKSTNIPVPTSTPSKARGKGIIIDDVTPLKAIEQENDIVMPKLDKKGRGKKRA